MGKEKDTEPLTIQQIEAKKIQNMNNRKANILREITDIDSRIAASQARIDEANNPK